MMKGIGIFSLIFLSVIVEGFGQKAPKPIVDTEPSATSILIQWKRTPSSHTITRWRLQYIPTGGKKKQVMIDADANEYLLEGLTPETIYRIRMLAQTATKGTGKPSAWEAVTTLSDTPVVDRPTPTVPESPENLAADAAATTARVTWDVPRDNGVAVLGYIISYGPRDNQRENILSVDVNPRVKEITGLDSNVQYRLTITAFNTEGQSDPATVDFFTLAEEIVKGPPPPVEGTSFRSSSPTSIMVTWRLPETTELNEIETIIVGHGDEGTPFKKLSLSNLGPRTTNHAIDGLQPETRYTVMVVSENRYGASKRVEITVETMSIPVTTPAPSKARAPPPSPENVDYSLQADGSVEITWTLPQTATPDEIENVGVGFGSYGIPAQFLTVTELGRTAVSYVTNDVTPGSRYTAMVLTSNRFGQSDPEVITVDIPSDGDESSDSSSIDLFGEEEVIYLEVPQDVNAEVLTTTSVRLSFIDPTLEDPSQEIVDRYYTVRYKSQDDINFQYIHFQQTNDVVGNLLPEANYQFEVKVVRGVNGHSLYSLPINVFTRDPDHASKVSDVTVVQLKIVNADNVLAIVNWLPPQTVPLQDITGYVLEYTEGYPNANTTWMRVNVSSSVPAINIDHLRSGVAYYLRVAHRIGAVMGPFSEPPDVVTTPTSQLAGQPYDRCGDQTSDQVVARVNWMRSGGPSVRTALLGVPLPYCDEYYARHECHGLVCFCIPGKRPKPDPSCGSPPGVQGDQPLAAPCHNEYKAALLEIEEARGSGKPVNDAHLPYCTDDGYYQSKQCLGSLCYCSTRDGMHTGKEVPIWEVNTLHC